MKILFTLLLATMAISTFAQDFESIDDGDWDDPDTWDSSVGHDTPLAGDEVIILDGHTITVVGAQACGDLTIEEGALVMENDDDSLTATSILLQAGTIEVSGEATLITGDLTLEPDSDDVELSVEESTLIITEDCEFNANTDGGCSVSFIDATVTITKSFIMGSLDGATSEATSSGTTITITRDLIIESDEDSQTTFEIDGGTVTMGDELRMRSDGEASGSSTQLTLIDGSLTALRFRSFETDGNSVIYEQQAGTTTITQNITHSGTDADVTQINMTAGTFNLGRNFLGSELTVDGGSTTGTFVFNGTAAQTVPTSYSTVSFNNLTLSNTLTTTINAPLTASNIKGNLSITAGTFNQATHDIDITSGNYSNAGTHSANADVSVSGDFTNTGTYTSTGSNITIGGDWTGAGTYTYDDGDIVLFNGTLDAQNLASAHDFWQISLDNGDGLTIDATPIRIFGVLDIDDGDFDANGNNVTLVSNASGTAQMDDIGTGSYNGDLIVQRFMNTSNQGFRELTSPVTGTTLSDWQNDGIIFSGFPGSNYPNFSFVNDYTYNEANANGDKNDGWVEATAMTNTITHNNGHRLYTDATAYTLSVAGNPTQGGITINLNNDGQGASDQSGWNLIGNPYAASIDWDLISAGDKNGLDDAYWVWATDGLVSPQYATYIGGGAGTHGATGLIPHSQAFWVHGDGTHAGANPSLTISESDKDITGDSFVKAIEYNDLSRIKAFTDAGLLYDETLLKVKTGSNNSFVSGEDQTKLYTEQQYWPNTISLATVDGSADMVYSEIGDANHTVFLKAVVGVNVTGNINLVFEELSNFAGNSCVILEDLHNGTTQNLRDNATYIFQNETGAPDVRFAIHMTKGFDAEPVSPMCFDGQDGAIEMTDLTGSNDIYWTDANGTILGSQLSITSPTYTILGLESGEHNVSVVGGSCITDSNTVSILVDPAIEVIASFEVAESTIYLNQNNGAVDLTNTSINATDYTWDMGDGTIYNSLSPVHSYTNIGNFTIELTVYNATNPSCINVTSETISVELTTDITDNLAGQMNIFSNGQEFIVESLDYNFNGTVNVRAMNGQTVFTKQVNLVNGDNLRINTDNFSSGIYIISLQDENEILNYKLNK